MNLRFLGIGKANAEIERLEKAITDEQAKSAKLASDLAAANLALTENSSAITATAEKAQADLTAATARIASIEAELATEKASVAKLSADLAEANANIADPKGVIVKLASAQAATITASQGQPPIAATAVTAPGASNATMSRAEFEKLSFAARNEFIRKGGKLTE